MNKQLKTASIVTSAIFCIAVLFLPFAKGILKGTFLEFAKEGLGLGQYSPLGSSDLKLLIIPAIVSALANIANIGILGLVLLNKIKTPTNLAKNIGVLSVVGMVVMTFFSLLLKAVTLETFTVVIMFAASIANIVIGVMSKKSGYADLQTQPSGTPRTVPIKPSKPKVAYAGTSDQSRVVVCPNCGLDNDSASRFCMKCGTVLSGADAPAAASQPAVETEEQNTYGGFDEAKSGYGAKVGAAVKSGRNAAHSLAVNKPPALLFIAAGVVVVAVAVVAVLFIFGGKGGEGDLSPDQLGEKYYNEQQYDKAAEQFEKVVSDTPADPYAYIRLAQAYNMSSGNTKRASDMIDTGIYELAIRGKSATELEIYQRYLPSELVARPSAETDNPAAGTTAANTASAEKATAATEAETTPADVGVVVDLTNKYLTDDTVADAVEADTEVTDLDLSGNTSVTDISSLAQLAELQTLNLSGTSVSDLKPLSGLSELKTLTLPDTVKDISPLLKLDNLEVLVLSNSNVSNLNKLSALPNLRTLDVKVTGSLSALSARLAKLDNISELSLKLTTGDGDITSLSKLSKLSNLKSLALNGFYPGKVKDITPLSGLTNLTSLSLTDNQISDIKPLSGLTNLTELKLGGNLISDIKLLSELTNLTNLELYRNKIINVNPLSKLTNLKVLNLNSNEIANIKSLSNLTELEELRLEGNPIKDFTPIESFMYKDGDSYSGYIWSKSE